MTTNETNEPERRAYLLHMTDAEYTALGMLAASWSGDVVKRLADEVRYARPRSDEGLADIGRDALRRDYYADVQSIADDAVLEAVKSAREGLEADEPTDWDDVREMSDDHAHESVDGSQWVIYTGRAMDVLRVSENDGAVEDYGTDGIVTDGSVNWSFLAYCAMRADVMERIADLIEAAESDEGERIEALQNEPEDPALDID